MTVSMDLLDKVEERNELEELFALQRAFAETQLLNKRDMALESEPLPEGMVTVWRVECACCGFGPWGVRKLSRLKAGMAHSSQQLYAATLMLNCMGKDEETGVMNGTCPPWSRVPEFQGNLHFGLRAGCLTREQIDIWFPKNKLMQGSKFVWAGYAVPADNIIESDNQVVFDRVSARRIFMTPVSFDDTQER